MTEKRKVWFYRVGKTDYYRSQDTYPEGVTHYNGIPYHPDSHGRDGCTEGDLWVRRKICNTTLILNLRCGNCRGRLTKEFVLHRSVEGQGHRNIQRRYLEGGEEMTDMGLWTSGGGVD